MAQLQWLVSLCAAAGLLAACGGEPQTPAAGSAADATGKPAVEARPNVLRRGNGAEPGTLDPHLAEGVPASNILRDLYEGLVTELPNGDLTGGIAESWDLSANGLTYTFKLRPNAKWSNGEKITAEHVVYSLRRAVDPATRSSYADVLSPIKNASQIIKGVLKPTELGARAVDASTVKIELGGVTPYFLGLLAHATAYPVYPPAVQEHGDKFMRPGNAVTSGAYTLAEHEVRSHIQLKRNSNYWDNAKTSIETVYYYPIEDVKAQLQRYLAHELDMADGLPPNEVKRIREKIPAEVKTFDTLAIYYFEFNLKKPPFDNQKVRQAMNLAIDREIIIKLIGKLNQKPAFSWVPPNTMNGNFYEPEYAAWTQEQRNEKAKQLLAESGVKFEKPVEILYNSSESHKKVALMISDMWQRVLGVKTTLTNQEWKVFLKTRDRGEFQVARAGWLGDYNDPFTFHEIMMSDHGQNNSGYANPMFDAFLKQAANQPDLVARADLMQKAEKILVEESPLIPIYFSKSLRMVKPWVKGFTPNLLGHFSSKHLSIEGAE